MSKILWLGLFFLFGINLTGQENHSHVINILDHNEYANYIHPLANGGYFIFGGGIEQINPEIEVKNYILSYDNEEQYVYYFDSIDSERAGNFILRNDTFYYLGQYKDDQFPRKLCLFKSNVHAEPWFLNTSVYTSSGNIIYPKRMCFDDQFIYTINQEEYEEDGKTYNVGKFLKLDYSGNVILEQNYDAYVYIPDFPDYKNHYNYFTDIDLLADSSLLMSFLYGPKGFDNRGAVYKTDLDGNVIWLKEFDDVYGLNGFPEALVLEDKTFIYIYNKDYRDTLLELENHPYEKPPVVYRMDSEGNILWEYVFETYPSWHWKTIDELIQAKNGDIIGVGSYRKGIPSLELGWIFRMNIEGEVLWERYYFEENYAGTSWFNDVSETLNEDLILAGSIDNDVDGEWTNNGYGWILRVDGDGCYYPGCSTTDTLQIIKANYYDSIPEFCPKGAKWSYGTVDSRYTGGLIYGYEEMSYSKDTLIDQKWCKILSRIYENKSGKKPLENVIIHQNKYEIYQYFDESFHLLFDFSKGAGDTLKLNLWKDWFGNTEDPEGKTREGSFLCRIDSVANKYYNDEAFKEFSCTLQCYEDPQNPEPNTLSDGIHFKITDKFFMIDGYWLFNSYSCLDDWNIFHDLRCYEDDEFGSIQFGDPEIGCDSILTKTTALIRKNETVLYPNPAFDHVSLKRPDSFITEKWKWNLINLTGKEVMSGEFDNSKEGMIKGLDDMKKGVYFFQVISESGQIDVKKLVIAK